MSSTSEHSHCMPGVAPAMAIRSAPGLRSGALARAQLYIDDHLFVPLRLDDVANAACVSRYHFSRCFTMSMGMTFVEYVARRRIDAARSALERDPAVQLAGLATELGFCDQAHFNKVFRRISGTTPRRYALRLSRVSPCGTASACAHP